jgi:hypothetical protein
VGVEPVADFAVTADNNCGYGDCPCRGAANALQDRRANCPALASVDADLQRVLAAWDGLPLHIRKTVLALVGFGDSAANA